MVRILACLAALALMPTSAHANEFARFKGTWISYVGARESCAVTNMPQSQVGLLISVFCASAEKTTYSIGIHLDAPTDENLKGVLVEIVTDTSGRVTGVVFEEEIDLAVERTANVRVFRMRRHDKYLAVTLELADGTKIPLILYEKKEE